MLIEDDFKFFTQCFWDTLFVLLHSHDKLYFNMNLTSKCYLVHKIFPKIFSNIFLRGKSSLFLVHSLALLCKL